MVIRVGLDSTRVLLTEVGRKWVLKNYPKGLIWEYDENKPWDLKSMGNFLSDGTIRVEFVELLYLGVPYRFPIYVDGEITFKMMNEAVKNHE